MKKVTRFTLFFHSAALAVLVVSIASSVFAQTSTSQPREERLLNGLKILMWNDAALDNVTVKIRIHSGAAFDAQGKEGTMRLLTDNIFPTEAAREFFEEMGGNLKITTDYDYIQIEASGKSEELLTILDTLSAAITNPPIDKPTTAKLKEALTTEVRQLEADPRYAASQAAANRLFGTFPYGRPKFGSPESIAKIDFADLIDAKLRFLTADNATVAITGNFNKTLAFRALGRYFGPWLKSDKRVPSTFRQPDPPPTALLTIPSPKSDLAAVCFAIRGVSRNDKEFAASKVYASILENRLRSRLPSAFADRVTVRAEEHILPGVLMIEFSASKNDIGIGNGKVEPTDLVTKALSEPVTEAEFDVAKRAFATAWAKHDILDLWLDIDTFKTREPATEVKAGETVSIAAVRTFAEKIKSAPAASVLINTPSK